MKKFFTAFAVFVILLVILVSCEKDPKPGPGPEPQTCEIITAAIGKGVITPDKTKVVLGSNVSFKLTPDAGYSVYSVKVSEVIDETFIPSPSEVNYNLMDVKKTYLRIEVTFVETGLLTVSAKSTQEKPWKWIKMDIYKASDNTFIRPSELTQAEKDRKYFFIYPSMELIVLNPDDSPYFKGTWDLKQNTFYRASEVMTALEISDKKIVIAAPPIWSNVDNCYTYAVYTYERI